MANVDQAQVKELSTQLMQVAEQVRGCERQIQLGKNQKAKTDLVLDEVAKAGDDQRMFRSLGRMFILVNKEELQTDLNNDLKRIQVEAEKATTMHGVLNSRKDELTKQLNDMVPAPQ